MGPHSSCAVQCEPAAPPDSFRFGPEGDGDDGTGKLHGNCLVAKVPECRGGGGAGLPLWRAREALLEELQALQARALDGEFFGVRLIRVEADIRVVGVEEAMLWLREQPAHPKVFFMNPSGSHMCAGAGAAHRVSGDGDLRAPLVPEGTPACIRYYGGSRFDAGGAVGAEWAPFGGHLFVLPQVELLHTRDATDDAGDLSDEAPPLEPSTLAGGAALLAVNVRADQGRSWADALGAAAAAVAAVETEVGCEHVLPPVAGEGMGTSFEEWAAGVRGALARFDDGCGGLRKVVLARNHKVPRVPCPASPALHVPPLLTAAIERKFLSRLLTTVIAESVLLSSRLSASSSPPQVSFRADVCALDILLALRTHRGYLFGLQPAPGAAFVGCSPEPLFRVADDAVHPPPPSY